MGSYYIVSSVYQIVWSRAVLQIAHACERERKERELPTHTHGRERELYCLSIKQRERETRVWREPTSRESVETERL